MHLELLEYLKVFYWSIENYSLYYILYYIPAVDMQTD